MPERRAATFGASSAAIFGGADFRRFASVKQGFEMGAQAVGATV